jgi:hypothetical protein
VNLLLACPTYGPVETMATRHLRTAMMHATNHGGVRWVGDVSPNRMKFDAARNAAVTLALKAEDAEVATADAILWVDSDVVLPIDAITRLVAEQKDFITGVYVQREPPHFPLIANFDPVQKTFSWFIEFPTDVVAPIDGCGFGCVLTSTRMLRRWARRGSPSSSTPRISISACARRRRAISCTCTRVCAVGICANRSRRRSRILRRFGTAGSCRRTCSGRCRNRRRNDTTRAARSQLMATGIAFPLQCDPTTKVEIWLFQRIGVYPPGPAGTNGKPVWRALPYNLVRFDGDPTEYIEPANCDGEFARCLDGTGRPIDPRADGCGNIIEFRFYDARPFEVFALNDLDVANNLGQLP